MDILDNRNITSKHLGRKGLHLNKARSTRLAKHIIYKLWKLVTEHLNESPGRVSVNISSPNINCDSSNSNYIASSKSFVKDEMISTLNMSITEVTQNSVSCEPFSNSKSSLNRIWVLIYIGSGLKTPHKSYLDESILTQSEISLIWL